MKGVCFWLARGCFLPGLPIELEGALKLKCECLLEHGVTVLDSYLRAPRFRATLEDITDEPAGNYHLMKHNRMESAALLMLRGVWDVNQNVSQVETQFELPVSEEPDVGHTQEPILAEVSTQEPIMADVSTQEPIVAEVSTEAPIVEEVGTQEFSVEDVVIEDYVSSGEDGEDAEQGTRPTGPNRGMEAGPSGSSGPTTRSKKRKNTDQEQLQRELEGSISIRAKLSIAKAKAEREIRGRSCLQVFYAYRL
ncbi:hypothetical protein Tco_0568277 [Tanacetum coccineum]